MKCHYTFSREKNVISLSSAECTKDVLQDILLLTFTTLLVNSADDKLMIFSYFISENRI